MAQWHGDYVGHRVALKEIEMEALEQMALGKLGALGVYCVLTQLITAYACYRIAELFVKKEKKIEK